jgi:hypothetical protein
MIPCIRHHTKQASNSSTDHGLTLRIVRSPVHQHPDAPHPLALLRTHCERPRNADPTKQSDKFPSPHSITSSARASICGRTMMPNAPFGSTTVMSSR